MGGNRNGLSRQCFNILVVFLLSGLWHGADWSFVVWGGLHGLYQICSLLWDRLGLRTVLPDRIRQGRTFLLVSMAWIFFRAASLSDAGILLSRLGMGWQEGGLLGLTWESGLRLGLILLCLHMIEEIPVKRKTTPAETVATVFFTVTAICLG